MSLTRKSVIKWLVALLCVGLIFASLFVGGYSISLSSLMTDPAAREMFFISRVPRTLALVLSGCALSISGVVMQMITQNKFVEPSTSGASQWAGLGILLIAIFQLDAPLWVQMGLSSLFAFIGTMVFLAILRRVALKSSYIVPIVGMMLGAVVGAISTYLAASNDLLQMLASWRSGGFTPIVRGNYEPLWIVALITLAVYFTADRFTVAGLGEEIATNVGLNYRAVVFIGSALVALATGVTAVVVGFLPFIGLVVPNIVSLLRGDNIRTALPWVALLGTGLILACDIVGRLVIAPLEIPVSVVLGFVGAAVFLVLILSRRRAS